MAYKLSLSVNIVVSAPHTPEPFNKPDFYILVLLCCLRISVQIVAEVYIIQPLHAVIFHNMDKVRLHIAALIVTAAGKKQLCTAHIVVGTVMIACFQQFGFMG